jgi:hypothetical protein
MVMAMGVMVLGHFPLLFVTESIIPLLTYQTAHILIVFLQLEFKL